MKISIGSKVLFKNGLLTIGLLYVVPSVFAPIISFVNHGAFASLEYLFNNQIQEIKDNFLFILVQVLTISLSILVYGDLYLDQIKKRNKVLVNFVTIFCFWIILFCTCTLTAGIEKAVRYGQNGFVSTIESWLSYGLIIFFFLAVINFFLIGFTMGNKILKAD